MKAFARIRSQNCRHSRQAGWVMAEVMLALVLATLLAIWQAGTCR